MSHQIIKQPNGKFSIFSTVVDHIVLYDATPDDIVAFYLKKELDDIKQRVNKVCSEWDNDEDPYGLDTMYWEDVLDEIEACHGKDDELLLTINKEMGEKQC